ncbi:hypothetical protein K505DRAFT_247558, partial [Melanomma pulvis-pyrius CBS 109.77]
YMDNEMVAWLIKNKLVPGQLEGETARVWNTILQIGFPATAGYATGPETQINGRRADFHTAHTVFGNRAQEFKFLIVECKRLAIEGQDQVWEDAGIQVGAYLSGIAKSRPSGRKFGAVAIGKMVRFYEWDTKAVSLTTLADGTYFYIDRQCATVVQ